MKTLTAPIAVFDSGAGGIGVLQEVQRMLPHENLFYFGDSAMAPYGERSTPEVRELVLRHAAHLLRFSKALVLACNTATAIAAEPLRARYPQIPIIGMEPALRPAVHVCTHPHVLVLATAATLREKKFASLLQDCAKNATVTALAAPGIVRLVEANAADSPEMDAYLAALLAPLTQPPDAVVLGCTHFPFALPAFRRVLGARVPVFDGAHGTARQTARRLSATGLCNPQGARGAVLLASSHAAALPLYRRLLAQKSPDTV
ncbi:MAG: glutamate racemase [Clostridia bacterium]|nr:glutamate racemase [Clostridia bacterium]